MSIDYAVLTVRMLHRGVRVRAAPAQSNERLSFDSSALEVMTDFSVVPAATTLATATLDEANQLMIRRGVRSLIVLDGATQQVVGMIGVRDVLGERPMQIALE